MLSKICSLHLNSRCTYIVESLGSPLKYSVDTSFNPVLARFLKEKSEQNGKIKWGWELPFSIRLNTNLSDYEKNAKNYKTSTCEAKMRQADDHIKHFSLHSNIWEVQPPEKYTGPMPPYTRLVNCSPPCGHNRELKQPRR